MKKVIFTLICLFAMMAAGTSIKAQEITISLDPGWNWISYPNTEAMTITAALGDFTPMQGDVIKSKGNGQSVYNNGAWRGKLTYLIPGSGYHYYSARTEYVEFVFARPASNVVVTATPTDITAMSAVVGGMVNVPEGTHVFLRGVCWGTAPNPDIDGDHTNDGTGIGSFNSTLEGLNPNTTYYVRAYAVSDHGLAYGSELSFTTLSGIPVVMTAEVSDVTGNSALCGGTVTTDGGLTVTARGVCWSTSHNPTLSDSHTTDGTGTGSFSSSLTGLMDNTTYYVRAYASNSYVTVYGNQRSFTTTSLPSYTVTVSSNPAEGGTAIGGGTYEQGQSCTVTATASEGYTFINWTENGEMVSADATYTFTVSGDRNLVAAFCEISTYPLLYWFNEDDHTATVTGHCFGQNATGELVIPETVMHYGETYTVTAIGDWAFSGCSGLTGNLFIPNTVTSIGFQSFGFCSGFSGNLIIPNSVSMIVERAFACCSGFTGELVISNSINRIEQLTFIGCSGFTGNLVIPSSVTSIAWGAFAECIGLTSITPLAEMPPTLTDNPFREFSRDIPIYVPCGSIEAYQNAEGWNEFMNFIEMCPDHAYVDLGLPSGTLWATCNVGADNPEDYGDYFAWGETAPKSVYNWDTYQYYDGSNLTKYTGSDGLTTLLPEDDAATANWGSDWRMPTIEEWQELYNNTTCTWTTQNGVNGRLFTASNGNSLFLPAAGYRYDSSLGLAGSAGHSWSSSLDTGYPDYAWYFYFDSGYYYMSSNGRGGGRSVRAVRPASQN